MKGLYVIILFFSTLLFACEKSTYTDTYQKSSNSGIYPTTYIKLDSSLIMQRRTDFLNKNQYLHSSLNLFGFCDWNGDPLLRGMPPHKGDITESQAKAIIKDFVSKNSSETGVTNLEYLNFSSSDKETGYAGSILWYIHSKNQKVENIEIMYSTIMFGLTNGNITVCLGNWYPEVYVPKNYNYDQPKAKTIMVGQEVSYGNFYEGGTSKKTITENDLNGCTFNLKIMPIDYTDKIELRVCWQLYAPSLSYKFYIDVMTGEILRKEILIYN